MNRRGFLGLLGTAAAGLMLDPERLLWVPGAKTIFLPTKRPSIWSPVSLTRGDIFTVDGIYSINPRTGRETPHAQQFVITADVTSGEVLLADVCPRLIFDGEWRNVHGVLTPQAKIRPMHVGEYVGEYIRLSSTSWAEALESA